VLIRNVQQPGTAGKSGVICARGNESKVAGGRVSGRDTGRSLPRVRRDVERLREGSGGGKWKGDRGGG
jgi:hypothetical protein